MNLVVTAGDRPLYTFKSDSPRFGTDANLRFALRRQLTALDVTGDGVPEILFGAGFSGVSAWAEALHVVHYDARRHRFVDVAHEQFGNSSHSETRWLSIDGLPIALCSHARPARDECHYCAHFYKYRAYCWEPERGAFRRIYRGRSRKRYDEEGPLGHELSMILPAIQRAARSECRRARPAS